VASRPMMMNGKKGEKHGVWI